ncbi:S1 family peptidase [Actinoplanes sp. N902-109]|uniref:S1 family peptidase n=1 Tax=Actinoplanes sp. (strain N902-109) TaxID=649831 RepID=UPI000329442A|nr:S1 family peptidase [Actinoplanes sp. N902-109]AGL17169.1 peptidase S1 and S6 chymotrypsin/Hap [Actinoplanes sp. N902-109]
MPRTLLAAAGMLAAVTLLAPPPAHAAAITPMPADAARAFGERLGDARTGGIYVDASGRAVVTVTDAADARSVRAAGGVARVVRHSLTELRSVTTGLDASARIPGTSWGVDPSTNQVSVEADSTVTGAKLDRLRAATARFGDTVRVDRVAGALTPATGTFTSGGQGIQDKNESIRCSIGFNVRDRAGAKSFLTAGHCGNENNTWYKAADGTYLGTVEESRFPGDDYAVVTYRNTDVSGYGTVWVAGVEQQITSSRDPFVGEQVARVGNRSSDMVGAVLLTDVTVNYAQGPVTGLIKTTLCAELGDSGGPLFDGSVALGLTSGAVGADQPCTSGVSERRSYYQPVQEVLDHAGLTVF